MHMHNDLLTNARVAVLGGAGFIGRSLVQRLSGAVDLIRVVDKSLDFSHSSPPNNTEFYDADVRDSERIGRAVKNCSVIFNLVGQGGHLESMGSPLADLESNVCAQLTILEACQAHAPGSHVIFASTRQVYGVPEFLPVPEHHPANPLDVNGINKLTAERYHLLYSRLCGIRSTVLRLTNTYGPGMRTTGPNSTFLGTWIRQALDGKPIRIFGDGSSVRDMTHVDDVVHAFIKTACTPLKTANEVFNVGSGVSVSLRQIAEQLISLLNYRTEIEFCPFPNLLERIDIGNYVADTTKFNRRTAWSAETPLAHGLRATLESFGLLNSSAP